MLLLSTPPLHRKWWGGSNNRLYARRPMISPHLAGIRVCWLTGGPLHKSVTFSCVFMLVQLNKCLVCGSDLQRRHSGDGWLSSSILWARGFQIHHHRVIKRVSSISPRIFFAISLKLFRLSHEQCHASRMHCITCAVFSVARPHSQSPSKYPHFCLCSLLHVLSI